MKTTSCCPALVNIENGVFPVAQMFVRPLNILVGRSFDKEGRNCNPSLVEKIAAVALIIFLSPIVLPAISLGLLILSLSSAHKEQVAQKMKQNKALSCEESAEQANTSVSTSEQGEAVNPRGLAPDQRETLLGGYAVLKKLLMDSSSEDAQGSGKKIDLDIISKELETSDADAAIQTFVTRASLNHALHKIDLREFNTLLIELGQPPLEMRARERGDSPQLPGLLRSQP